MDTAIPAARRALIEAMREPQAPAGDLVALVKTAAAQRPGAREQELATLTSELERWEALAPAERRLLCARALRVLSALAATLPVGEPAPRRTGRPASRRAQGPRPAATPTDPVEALTGIGPGAGAALRARGLHRVEDLAGVLPRTYEDRRQLHAIGEVRPGSRAVVRGTVAQARWVGRGRFEALLEDGTGRLRLVFFRAYAGHKERFAPGRALIASGDVTEYRGAVQMVHPEVEQDEPSGNPAEPGSGPPGRLRSGRIVPVYPEVPGVTSRVVERAIRQAVSVCIPTIPDGLPEELRVERALIGQGEALALLHDPPQTLPPEELEALCKGKSAAHHRLAYDEFFFLSLGIHRRRQALRRASAPAMSAGAEEVARLRKLLAFDLTGAQDRVIREIAHDLEKGEPMQRLLQGDVGSGKTLVALATVLKVAASGAQTALMAPTEILAEQHLRGLRPLLEKLGFRAVMLVGSQRSGARREGRRALELGSAQLAIGTHALLSEGVDFQRLGLVIVDEQHRFGVAQRLRLLEKGRSPHLLVMTATPIPRTLALTVYGDLDLSIIDEMPPGRLPVDTRVIAARRFDDVVAFLSRALERGERGYYICPLVSQPTGSGGSPDATALDLAAATERHALLGERFGTERVALLHGQMKPEDKEAAMAAFLAGRARLLVSTTVVEVGIDVQAATFMVIEGAERFGLSQLHQLRGRVGRGTEASRCLLVSGARGDALERLRQFVQATDGFAVAELDLSIRGPGELFGLRQSGLPGFRFGDLLRDVELLAMARADAAALLARDPALDGADLALTRTVLDSRWRFTGTPVGEEAG